MMKRFRKPGLWLLPLVIFFNFLYLWQSTVLLAAPPDDFRLDTSEPGDLFQCELEFGSMPVENIRRTESILHSDPNIATGMQTYLNTAIDNFESVTQYDGLQSGDIEFIVAINRGGTEYPTFCPMSLMFFQDVNNPDVYLGTLIDAFTNECNLTITKNGSQAVVNRTWDQVNNGMNCSNLQDGQTPMNVAAWGTTTGTPTSFDQDELTETEPEPTCESVPGGLGWIICPIILATDSVLNWVDTQIQGLLAVDENKYKHEDLQQAWAIIRNIAYIVLIPIMLVMVIGTALGVEVFSAYTVKKALPRMVIAVIFISLSWYITTFLIDFFNIVGHGVLGLLTYPFDFNGNAVSTLSLADLFTVNGGGFWNTILAQGALTLGIVVTIWLFLAPLALIIVTTFLVLFLRQMFIVALSLLAPLAILSWIFPGNDKLWKLWWGAFSKLLMMFPLIMVLIAVGRIFAAILAGPFADGGFDGFLTPIFVLAAYLLPYAAIPFTFKMAGGMFATITGMAQDREKGMFARMKEKRGEKVGRKTAPIKGRVTNARWGAATRLNQAASSRRGIAARGLRGLSRITGGYRPDEAQSAATAEASKRFNDAVATGPDNVHRALTAKYAMDMGFENAEKAKLARINKETGRRQYKTLGGAWADEADVIEADKRWGNDRHFQQAALSYEMKKAISEDQVENIKQHYGNQVSSWGMSDLEAQSAWKGAGFQNQDQHLEFKHTSWGGHGKGLQLDGKKLLQETYERRGTYNMSQLNAQSIKSISAAYDEANAVITTNMIKDSSTGGYRAAKADEIAAAHTTKYQAEQTIENFISRYASGGTEFETDAAGNVVPVSKPDGASTDPGRQTIRTNTQGAAHVAEEVRKAAVHMGLYQDIPQDGGSTNTPPKNPSLT